MIIIPLSSFSSKLKICAFTFILLCTSCSRPLYIKDRHFQPVEMNYKMDTDLKELVYKSIERAFVVEKDIPDYWLLWKKHRIYVSPTYQKSKTSFKSNEDWNSTASHLEAGDVPNAIEKVQFSLKSREELQKIADRTWEDFLHISFSLIKIEVDIATVHINNSWIISKHTKMSYLSGGGYSCVFKKNDGVWVFQKKTHYWIS